MKTELQLKTYSDIKKFIENKKLTNIFIETGDKNVYIPHENKFIVTKTFLQGESNIFINCKTLETINMENFDFSEITRMDRWFAQCKNLIKVIFPRKANCGKLKNVEGIFAHSAKLQSVDLSFMEITDTFKFPFGEIENFMLWRFAFFQSKICKVTLPICKINNMQECFYRCDNLEEIVAPVQFQFSQEHLFMKTFRDCKNLKLIEFSEGQFDITKMVKQITKPKNQNNLPEDCVVILPNAK